MRGRSGAVRVRKPLSYEKKKNLAGLLFIYTIMDCMTDIANPIMQYMQSVIDALQMEYSMALSWVYFAVCIVGIGIVYAIVNRFVYYEV